MHEEASCKLIAKWFRWHSGQTTRLSPISSSIPRKVQTQSTCEEYSQRSAESREFHPTGKVDRVAPLICVKTG